MIQRTSAVTTTVLGEIKIIGLLLLSSLLLGACSSGMLLWNTIPADSSWLDKLAMP